MKIYDLPVMGYDRAKSFYGKAKVIEKDNGEKVLQSYNTEVCKISSNGELFTDKYAMGWRKVKTLEGIPASVMAAVKAICGR